MVKGTALHRVPGTDSCSFLFSQLSMFPLLFLTISLHPSDKRGDQSSGWGARRCCD